MSRSEKDMARGLRRFQYHLEMTLYQFLCRKMILKYEKLLISNHQFAIINFEQELVNLQITNVPFSQCSRMVNSDGRRYDGLFDGFH